MRFVIIGANAAGLSAALRIRRQRPDAEVLVLEATQEVSWGACGIPMNAADPTRSASDLRVRSLSWLQEQGLDLRLGHRVMALDLHSQKIVAHLDNATPDESQVAFVYDRLVIATGAKRRDQWWPGLRDDQFVSPRRLEDLHRLKPLLKTDQRVFILGTGLLGLEMADALHTLGLRVCLVDQEDLPLSGFPVSMRKLLLKRLEERKVSFFGGYTLKRVRTVSGGFLPEFENGESCGPQSFQLFLDCTGSLPASDFVRNAGLAVDPRGAIFVDSTMATSDPAVWAAGDCCVRRHLIRPLPEEVEFVWNPQALEANRGGRVAGLNAATDDGKAAIELPLSPATQIVLCFGLELARTGRLNAASLEDDTSKTVVDGDAPHPAYQGLLGLKHTPSVPSSEEQKTRAVTIQSRTRGHALPEASLLTVYLESDAQGLLRGAAILSDGPGALRINQVAALLQNHAGVENLLACDFAYSPPFGPTFDPLLIAASELKKLTSSSS